MNLLILKRTANNSHPVKRTGIEIHPGTHNTESVVTLEFVDEGGNLVQINMSEDEMNDHVSMLTRFA